MYIYQVHSQHELTVVLKYQAQSIINAKTLYFLGSSYVTVG